MWCLFSKPSGISQQPLIPRSSFSLLKTRYFKVVYPKLLDFNNNFHRLGENITSTPNIQRYFMSSKAEKTNLSK